MSWHLPVPNHTDEAAGTTWRVRQAWLDNRPGNYVLAVPGQDRTRAVRGACPCPGSFELLPLDDPGLPVLRAEARQGEFTAPRTLCSCGDVRWHIPGPWS